MMGANGNDVLVGGDDVDSADGAKGNDECSAETETKCET